mgnify:CR=1 FL=1
MAVIDLLLLIGGVFILIAIVVKPNFFWESRGMQRRRAMIGDNKTVIMYVITAVIMLAVGIWGAMGGF